MARKVRRRKKSAARKPVARRTKRRVKRRVVKRRKVAKKTAAPKRRRRRAKKVVLKANRRRRLRRNKGTRTGALKGWRTRRAKSKAAPKRKRRRSRKVSTSAKRRKHRTPRRSKRKLSMKKSAVAARRRRRAAAKLKPNRRRRSRRRLSANRKRRSSRRRMSSNRRRRARLSPNRRRSHRRMSSNRRRHRRNGRRMFKKNGIMEPVVYVLKTGAIALGGLAGHKLLKNVFAKQVMNRIFGSGAVVVATSPTTTATVAPATSGLGGLSLDPSYQTLISSFLVAAGGVALSAKVIKDQGARNTVMTGIAVSFAHDILTFALQKFAPQYSNMLNGADDGTAARLSAMYGLRGTSIQPRYQAINGMGEYFSSGVSGLGEYFSSGVNGLGEYFSSGVNGLGSSAYEAAAGMGAYGANPDLMEAAAGMGAQNAMNTNHIDPSSDLDRELTIAEAAAGIGALPSYEASAGYGSISSLPTTSTWIPGTSDGQLWAGTRSISAPQSASEMVPAGILQTDGGQGVFG
jgi:hypothetical protein